MKEIRKIALKVLKATAFDVKIRHHLTKSKFLINTYHHKGYWYYGSKREEESIKVFRSWIKPEQFVLEIGGHIGYFSTFYAFIVGAKGKVDVFEPSMLNARYLNRNIKLLPSYLNTIISVVNKGAGDEKGVFDFYIDPITGQNNSFVKDFEGFYENRKNSAEGKTELIHDSIAVIRLDDYFENKTRLPDFVKIDVEGFEWNVIKGFEKTIIKTHPKMMIEVQRDVEKIIPFFKNIGYSIYNDRQIEIIDIDDYFVKKTPNLFFKFDSYL